MAATTLPQTRLTHVKLIASALELEPGCEAEVSDDFAISAHDLSAQDLVHPTAWRDGRIDFDRKSLVEAVADMSRYTSVRVVTSDPSIEEIHPGGNVRATDVPGFLESIHDSFGIDATALRTDKEPEGCDTNSHSSEGYTRRLRVNGFDDYPIATVGSPSGLAR